MPEVSVIPTLSNYLHVSITTTPRNSQDRPLTTTLFYVSSSILMMDWFLLNQSQS